MGERDSFRQTSQHGCDGAQAFAGRKAHASAPADPADAALSLVRILVLPGADEDAAERLGTTIGVARSAMSVFSIRPTSSFALMRTACPCSVVG